ncbi:hypothetical protein [Aeromonas dhakensis]|uniref:hypothetical protein n=1 Tax=Aeromonas dhakensis TaxID=196024 RepID=UPI002B467302|nr:hypothetical protein [Aeromonas dhakensis]
MTYHETGIYDCKQLCEPQMSDRPYITGELIIHTTKGKDVKLADFYDESKDGIHFHDSDEGYDVTAIINNNEIHLSISPECSDYTNNLKIVRP